MSYTTFQNQMFNPVFVNQEYLQKMQIEIYNREQSLEIQKAVKATKDLCDVIKRISPDYQQAAFVACASVVLNEFNM